MSFVLPPENVFIVDFCRKGVAAGDLDRTCNELNDDFFDDKFVYKPGGVEVRQDDLEVAKSLYAGALESMEKYCGNVRTEPGNSTRTTMESYFDAACQQQLKKRPLKPETEAEAQIALESLKRIYSVFNGDDLSRTRTELFFTEDDEQGDDVVLPFDVLDAFSSELKDEDVELNQVVTQIDWNKDSVTVKTDRHTFTADHVICTLPIGVLQQKHKSMFSPELPPNKVKAFNAILPGQLSKYFFDWETKWRHHTKDIVFADQSSLSPGQVAQWTLSIGEIMPVPGFDSLLMCWTVGDGSRLADSLPDDQVILKSCK